MVRKPLTGEPTTGAVSSGVVIHAMAFTRSRLSQFFRTARRPTGTIITPAMPCTKRTMANCVRLWQSEHRTEEAPIKPKMA